MAEAPFCGVVVRAYRSLTSAPVDVVVPRVQVGITTASQLGTLLQQALGAHRMTLPSVKWVFVHPSGQLLPPDSTVDESSVAMGIVLRAFFPDHGLHVGALAAARAVAVLPQDRVPAGRLAVCWRQAPVGVTCWRVLPADCTTVPALFAALRAAWPQLPGDARVSSHLAGGKAYHEHDERLVPGASLADVFGADTTQLMVCTGGPEVQLFVKTLTGCTITVTCSPDAVLADLQAAIAHRTGVAPHHQTLIYAGRQLERWVPMSVYGVQKESTLHLVLRCRGGGEAPPSTSFADMRHKSSGAATAVPTTSSLLAVLWKVGTRGACLEGHCDNAACPSQATAVPGQVYLHFGIGRVCVPDAIAECVAAGCPACHTTDTRLRIRQIVFAKCAYVAVGSVVGGEGGTAAVVQRGATSDTGYDRFLAGGPAPAAGAGGFGGGADADWTSLDVYTLPLEVAADVGVDKWEPETLRRVVPLATDHMQWEDRMASICEQASSAPELL